MEYYMANPNRYYVKQNVNHREYFMQKYIYNLDIVNIPEIIEYNSDSKIMVMKKVGKDNLSHTYGENADDIPDDVFDQVVKIVRNLVLHNIEYPDLTGYNFIEDTDGKVWIIDFEHSSMMTSKQVNNIHIQNICNGYKKWNPDFK
jgi:RIO-like serine/threonine protein kinase